MQKACYHIILAYLKGESKKNYRYLLQNHKDLLPRLWEEVGYVCGHTSSVTQYWPFAAQINLRSELTTYAVEIVCLLTENTVWVDSCSVVIQLDMYCTYMCITGKRLTTTVTNVQNILKVWYMYNLCYLCKNYQISCYFLQWMVSGLYCSKPWLYFWSSRWLLHCIVLGRHRCKLVLNYTCKAVVKIVCPQACPLTVVPSRYI